MNTIITKPIQGGGTTKAMGIARNTIEMGGLAIYSTQTLNTIEEDAIDKAKEQIDCNNIILARDLKSMNLEQEDLAGKLIIYNKHSTYASRVIHAVALANKDGIYAANLHDEYDADGAGYEFFAKNVKKDKNLNALAGICTDTFCISATNFAGAITDWEWDNWEHIEPTEEYLGFKDCEILTVPTSDINTLIEGGITGMVKSFLESYWEEGILIRTDRYRVSHELIKNNIKALGIPATIINTDNKNSAKEVRGVVIALDSTPRAVTTPNLRHEMVAYGKKTPQNTIIQSLRILGYGKKGDRGNYIMCSNEDRDRILEAEEQENRIIEEGVLNLKKDKRLEWVHNLRVKKGSNPPLAKNKMNGHSTCTIKKQDLVQPLAKNVEKPWEGVPILDEIVLQKDIPKHHGNYKKGWGAETVYNNLFNIHPQLMNKTWVALHGTRAHWAIPMKDEEGNLLRVERSPDTKLINVAGRQNIPEGTKIVGTLTEHGNYTYWRVLARDEIEKINTYNVSYSRA